MKKSDLRKIIREQIENNALNTIYITQLEAVISSMEAGNGAGGEYINTLKGLVAKMKEEN